MFTPRTVLILVVGLVAGAIGLYAGLIALLAVTGLDNPGWAPVAQLTGSALFAAVAVAMASDLENKRAGFVSAVTAAGGFAGLAVMTLDLDFEAAVIAALVILGAATIVAQSLDKPSSSPERSSGSLTRTG